MPILNPRHRLPGEVDHVPWDEMVIARALHLAANYAAADTRGDRDFQNMKDGEIGGFLGLLNSRYPDLVHDLEQDWFHREEWAWTGKVGGEVKA